MCEVSRRESVLKNYFYRLVKKIPDARRARNRRAEAYMRGTLERGGSSATKQMGLFQRPVLFTTVHVDYSPAHKAGCVRSQK